MTNTRRSFIEGSRILSVRDASVTPTKTIKQPITTKTENHSYAKNFGETGEVFFRKEEEIETIMITQ
ncbi:MAG: hypothetical protein AB7E63_04630 [Parachlamydia sp.]